MGRSKKRETVRIPRADHENLRLWAEGARGTILQPHIDGYMAALDQGWRQERTYVKKVCLEFHARVSWRTQDHEEPVLDENWDPATVTQKSQPLPEEEEKLKRARVKVLDKHHSSAGLDPTKDPYTILLAKLSGLSAPPKARQAFHLQSPKTVRGMHATLIMGGPMPKYGGDIRTVDTSYGHNHVAIPTHWGQWDTPRFQHQVADFMIEFLQTAYSPEDCADAALTAVSALSGAKYRIDEAKQNQSDSDSNSEPSSSGSDSDSEGDRGKKRQCRKNKGKSGKQAAAAPTPSDSDDEDHGREQKKVRFTTKTTASTVPIYEDGLTYDQVRDHNMKQNTASLAAIKASQELAAPTPTPVKPRPKPRPRKTDVSSAPRRTSTRSFTCHTSSKSPTLAEEPSTSTSSQELSASTSAPMTSDASLSLTTAVFEPSTSPTLMPAPMSLPTLTLSSDITPAPAHAASPHSLSGAAAPSAPGASLSLTTTPPAIMPSILVPFPAKAAVWFVEARAEMTKVDLGCHFQALLTAWTRVEDASRFEHGPQNLAANGHPTELKTRIARKRGKTGPDPIVTDPSAYTLTWQGWWDSLQPASGEKSEGSLGHAWTEWGDLYGWGVNGTLTIITSLYFWGVAVIDDTGDLKPPWVAAVNNVCWIMEGLATFYEMFNKRFDFAVSLYILESLKSITGAI
ncbi:hypothetical protein C8R43DRAFT_944944 [Mycena crocata]|nr:hypothetical protein C8R43DRAFT_944944 [Mycena crocata]